MNKIPNIKCYGTNIHIQVHKHVCVCLGYRKDMFLSLTLFKYSLYTLNLSNNQHQNFISKFPSLKDNLFRVWLKFAQWFLRRKCSNFINQFSQFHFYFPWDKHPLHPPWMLCQVWLKLFQMFLSRCSKGFIHLKKFFRAIK